MRYLNLLGIALMLGFAAVQVNDPDAPLWIALYAVPAGWAYFATFRRPQLRASATGMRLLWASVALYTVAVIVYWPAMPGFWRKDVWMAEEGAREGMGVMIALAVVLLALAAALRRTDPVPAGVLDGQPPRP